MIVVTRIPDPGDGGNLALPDTLYFQTEEPSEKNQYLGTHVQAARVMGMAYLSLRAPVFRLGEILTLDSNDRDLWGRKPSKWDIDVEHFDTYEKAFARARQVVEAAE